MKKVSMQDIADKLGVSKGTVSLVLSGKAKSGRISDETSQKVRQLAVEMNYYPNEIARSLTTGKSMSIGVIITDISNEFFGNLTFHIQERAKKYGYTVITTNTNERLDEFNDAVTILLNRQTDGIILVPVDGGEEITQKIIARHIPLVQVDRFYPAINASYIIVDNYKISAKMTEMLIEKGNRRIAVVCYDIKLNALMDRKQGCIDVLNQHNLFDPALIKDINYEQQEEEIHKAIVEFKNNTDKVDAIFFCSRRVFITGMKYMHKEGIRISEEMDVVCFDKIDSFSIANIPFNFIEQPIKDMGEKAVDILMSQINGKNTINQYLLEAQIRRHA